MRDARVAPMEAKLCQLCDEQRVEDQTHLLIECPAYAQMRPAMLKEAETVWRDEGGRAKWSDLANVDEEVESGVWDELNDEQQAMWLLQSLLPRVCGERNSFLVSAVECRRSLLARLGG